MESSKNDSKQLWLAAVMFFNIMVRNFLKNNDGEFSADEKNFIQSYVQYGYLSIISGAITIVLVVLYYLYPSTLLYWIHTLSIVATLAIVIIGSIGVLSGSILYHKEGIQYTTMGEEKDKIVLYFIPLYNIITRYSTHQFNEPNPWLKESLLRWTLRAIISIGQSQILLVFWTILIVIRVVTIAAGIDILQNKVKNILQQAFTVNPEELRAYCIATIDFIAQKLQQKIIQPSRKELLLAYQKTYSHLHPIDTAIIIQYSIGGLCIIGWIRSIYQTQNTILYIPVLVIVARYIIMYKKRKHLPPLPVAREIYLFVANISNKTPTK
jgi:hypothetical protein